MAKLIKGKAKGKDAKVCQWSNDWFQVEVDLGDGPRTKIVSPTMLQLSPAEVRLVRATWEARTAGNMPAMYTLADNGMFALVVPYWRRR